MEGYKRGVIRNRKTAMHIRDFSGLAWGAITPTDIDAFLDFGGKVFVFIEAKCEKAECPNGQRLALERLCGACQQGGVETLVIIASHKKTEEDIDYEHLSVREFHYRGEWHQPPPDSTVRKFITKFRNDITMGRLQAAGNQ